MSAPRKPGSRRSRIRPEIECAYVWGSGGRLWMVEAPWRPAAIEPPSVGREADADNRGIRIWMLARFGGGLELPALDKADRCAAPIRPGLAFTVLETVQFEGADRRGRILKRSPVRSRWCPTMDWGRLLKPARTAGQVPAA